MVFQEYSIFPWKTVRTKRPLWARPRRRRPVRGEPDRRRMDRSARTDRIRRRLPGHPVGRYEAAGLHRPRASRFAALEAQLRTVLQDELLQLWDSHPRSALFVTHSLDEAILLGDRVIVMSSRPGKILESVNIDFPRPRSPQLRSDQDFRMIEQRLWGLLRAEIDTGVAEARDE